MKSRIQKSAVRIILGSTYTHYEDALEKVDLQSLRETRDEFCLNFAQKCIKNDKLNSMFPLNLKSQQMELINEEIFNVNHAHTDRYMILHTIMQRLIYKETQDKENQRNTDRMPG